jgi:hypothetical protein
MAPGINHPGEVGWASRLFPQWLAQLLSPYPMTLPLDLPLATGTDFGEAPVGSLQLVVLSSPLELLLAQP